MPVTQVETVMQARPLFESVCRWAVQLGMRFHGIPVQVRLVARQTSRPGHMGSTLHRRLWRGRKLVRNRIYGIEIVRGLDPVRFQGVAAHELGHVWLTLHRISVPAGLEEGFCELLAHRFYCDLGTEEARRSAREIETNPDPLYGGGFRRLRELVGLNGLQRVLRERQFPARLNACSTLSEWS